MRALRLLLLLVLLVPTAALASPYCDESAASGCCGPGRDCSETPFGACGAGLAVTRALPVATYAPGVALTQRLALDEPFGLRPTGDPRSVADERTPATRLYIILSTLRN